MMMIRFLIIILIVLVGAAALTSLNPSAEDTTNPILKGLANVRSWFTCSPAPKLPLPEVEKDENATKVYKWQDESGEWHFSNQPPPSGVASSVETYRSDVNITQAPPPPVEEKQEPAETDTEVPQTAVPLLPITDPERVQKLIEDAQNVQKLVDQRQEQIDQQLKP
jgi:hypothetical protein